jgi:MFS family permease
MRMMRLTGRRAVGEVDSVYAWLRLLVVVFISTIGGVGMWSIAVVLPTLQADFGVTRADISLASTAVILGAVVGGPVMGWLSDRFGIIVPVAIGAAMLALGLALASQAATMWQFTLVHGLLIGGSSSGCSALPKCAIAG